MTRLKNRNRPHHRGNYDYPYPMVDVYAAQQRMVIMLCEQYGRAIKGFRIIRNHPQSLRVEIVMKLIRNILRACRESLSKQHGAIIANQL